MEQKTTWKHYLFIGIISIMCLFSLSGCKGNFDYVVKGTYVYINKTDSIIEVKWLDPFTIAPGGEYVIERDGDGPKDVTSDTYAPPTTWAIIIYNNSKCDTIYGGGRNGTGEGITGIINYTNQKIGDNHYKFTYTFTNADFKNAVKCK